ncbi:CidB/LrgB family autolysis modulator [[Haemophilus] ducreyi]|nr:LrgB family protein [[Haemophilus] ducreyi]AKO31617.1 deoxyguanosinetriphosphate triphosphohydrolase [[Haemophilus] ducreyi]AKO33073.1 deoxyguanosinetriphosphate triphosphohydrolase [[Haemophilus] ducreyi]AKO34522.1 deoxyguanosinetriphosphate triphosphohydrolase [[Haemophilus] ducreyi]AKO35957.1 deoxyguanosinetriphosphate triphosphohydrolase [[Haemophilus] ducreyi]AKO37414.1 deoxyguanosinetriphosphate triphosphohydrolase [[Haemophilus] ducreyi]
MIYLFSGLTLIAFFVGQKISQKLRTNWLNPFLLALLLIIVVLGLFDIPFAQYYQGNAPINDFLSVSVVALALPFYEQLPQIRKNWRPISAVLLFGTLISMLSGLLFALLLGANQQILAAILAKSVSTPIAVAIATPIGGNAAITAVGVMIAGLIGSVLGFTILHLINVRNMRAVGLTMGTVSHVLGTGRCMEYSIKAGSYSSIALVASGVLSSILAPLVFKLAIVLCYS